MKFRTSEHPRKKVRATLDLTPLIDVVFQLLIFFMLSSTFVVQSSIQIEIPEAKGTKELEKKDLTVTLTYGTDGLDGAGSIYINNDEMVSWPEFSRRLEEEAASQPDLLLLFRSDSRVSVDRLIRAMGYARSVGIERFGIAAEPPSDEE